ncbi:MAG: chemotaxis protein CheW [Deltaproteobacteria bacterium]|nr:MAG: chemotaxis protein CheW [Deltaproteobacteria bacterium]
MRVRTGTLDRFLSTVGEVILTSSQLRTDSESQDGARSARLSTNFDRIDRVVGELQRRVLDLRTTPLARVMETMPRVAREVARATGKQVEVEVRGAELELDRSILDRLTDPLAHVVRNAVDHGLETPDVRRAAGKRDVGRLLVDARRERDSIRIDVCDDGRGIDLDSVRDRAVEAGLLVADLAEDLPAEQIAQLIFHPGLSTAAEVSQLSGRGVGMDAVRTTVESLGGHVEIDTVPGRGTTLAIVVPVSAAVQRVVLLAIGSEMLAVPISKVERLCEMDAAQIERSGNEAFVLIDDEPVPVLDLSERLGVSMVPSERSPTEAVAHLALVDVRGDRVALRATRFAGQQEIYVKPVPALFAEVRALAGFTVLGDGRPIFLLDLNQLS